MIGLTRSVFITIITGFLSGCLCIPTEYYAPAGPDIHLKHSVCAGAGPKDIAQFYLDDAAIELHIVKKADSLSLIMSVVVPVGDSVTLEQGSVKIGADVVRLSAPAYFDVKKREVVTVSPPLRGLSERAVGVPQGLRMTKAVRYVYRAEFAVPAGKFLLTLPAVTVNNQTYPGKVLSFEFQKGWFLTPINC